MPIVFNCPECQKQLRIQDGMSGKKVRCPHCKAIAVAPAEEEPIVATPVDDDEAVTSEAPPPRPRAERRERRRDRDDDDDDEDRDDYEAPRARRDRSRRRRDGDDVEDDRDLPRGMPSSVVLAIIALCIMLGLQLINAVMALTVAPPELLARMLVQTVVGIVLGGLILWGLITGHRLAWQWGRIAGLLGAILAGIVGMVAIAGGQPGDSAAVRLLMALVFLTISTCLFIITFSLGTRSARLHFRLRCPSCGRFTSSAADFFFNMAKCKRCKEVW